MKFIVRKASDYDTTEEKEINTLEELYQIIEKEGNELIVGSTFDTQKPQIIIYDDYVE